MATCAVCGTTLPARRGPRARVYCSRACQAKAYRARQEQHTGHRAATADEPALLREYEGAGSLALAEDLASAARRLAKALNSGLRPDDFDLGVLARIPFVLSARARQATPAAEAVGGRPDTTVTPAAAIHHLAPEPALETPVPAPAESSRDDSQRRPKRDRSRTPARPKRLSKKAALVVVDAAELVKDPDHRDTNRWKLLSGDTLLGHVEPSYGGTSRTGRNGWVGIVAGGYVRGTRQLTRQAAAVDLAGAWIRLRTAPPRT